MLKKILLTATALLAAAALAACGSENKQEETTPEPTTEAVTTQAEPATTEAPTTKQPETTAREIETQEGLVLPEKYLDAPYTGAVVSDGEGLTLRLGPGTDYEGFDNIPDDTELTIEAEQDGWGFTSYRDQYGWVFLEFVA